MVGKNNQWTAKILTLMMLRKGPDEYLAPVSGAFERVWRCIAPLECSLGEIFLPAKYMMA